MACNNFRTYFSIAGMVGGDIGAAAGSVAGIIHGGVSKLAHNFNKKTGTRTLKDYIASDIRKGYIAGDVAGRATGLVAAVVYPTVLAAVGAYTVGGALGGAMIGATAAPIVYCQNRDNQGNSSLENVLDLAMHEVVDILDAPVNLAMKAETNARKKRENAEASSNGVQGNGSSMA